MSILKDIKYYVHHNYIKLGEGISSKISSGGEASSWRKYILETKSKVISAGKGKDRGGITKLFGGADVLSFLDETAILSENPMGEDITGWGERFRDALSIVGKIEMMVKALEGGKPVEGVTWKNKADRLLQDPKFVREVSDVKYRGNIDALVYNITKESRTAVGRKEVTKGRETSAAQLQEKGLTDVDMIVDIIKQNWKLGDAIIEQLSSLDMDDNTLNALLQVPEIESMLTKIWQQEVKAVRGKIGKKDFPTSLFKGVMANIQTSKYTIEGGQTEGGTTIESQLLSPPSRGGLGGSFGGGDLSVMSSIISESVIMGVTERLENTINLKLQDFKSDEMLKTLISIRTIQSSFATTLNNWQNNQTNEIKSIKADVVRIDVGTTTRYQTMPKTSSEGRK
jgi:hypothetical protein